MNNKQKRFNKAIKENSMMRQAAKFLTEGEIENAQSALAAKDLVDRVQDMVTELGKMSNEDLPTVTDSIRATFGAEVASEYSSNVGQQLTTLLTTVKAGRDALENSTLSLTGDGSQAAPAVPSEGEMPEGGEGDGFAAEPAATGKGNPLGRDLRDEAMEESKALLKSKLAEAKNKVEANSKKKVVKKEDKKPVTKSKKAVVKENSNKRYANSIMGLVRVNDIVTVVEGSGKKYRVARINESVAILKDAKGNVVGKKDVKKLAKVEKKKPVKEGVLSNAFNKVSNMGLTPDKHNITGRKDRCKNCGTDIRKGADGKVKHANFKDDIACKKPMSEGVISNAFNKVSNMGLNPDRHNITGKAKKCKNCGYDVKVDENGGVHHSNFKDDNNCKRPQLTEAAAPKKEKILKLKPVKASEVRECGVCLDANGKYKSSQLDHDVCAKCVPIVKKEGGFTKVVKE